MITFICLGVLGANLTQDIKVVIPGIASCIVPDSLDHQTNHHTEPNPPGHGILAVWFDEGGASWVLSYSISDTTATLRAIREEDTQAKKVDIKENKMIKQYGPRDIKLDGLDAFEISRDFTGPDMSCSLVAVETVTHGKRVLLMLSEAVIGDSSAPDHAAVEKQLDSVVKSWKWTSEVSGYGGKILPIRQNPR